jgi:hypothetical protein
MQSVHQKNIISKDVMKKIMNYRHKLNKNKEYLSNFFQSHSKKRMQIDVSLKY